ncbi:MAG: hypothetical protein LBV12_13115 [Puniceicoccales bacterium]|nr:hypothetical protein [Puniceicoccales bacterium]
MKAVALSKWNFDYSITPNTSKTNRPFFRFSIGAFHKIETTNAKSSHTAYKVEKTNANGIIASEKIRNVSASDHGVFQKSESIKSAGIHVSPQNGKHDG